MHTLEDIVEILVGKQARAVNIRIDRGDARLLISIAKQIEGETGLTDRQSELILKKIQKYSSGLAACGVDTALVLSSPAHRIPVRHIDRSQTITLKPGQGKERAKIIVKYVFSKNFAEVWSVLEDDLTHITSPEKNIKEIEYTEQNLISLVTNLRQLSFEVSDEIEEIYQKTQEIAENPRNFLPYLDIEGNNAVIKNAHSKCQEYLTTKFSKIDDYNLLSFVNKSKACGIHLKSPDFIKKLNNVTTSSLTKKILIDSATRFRFDEKQQSLNDLFNSIDEIDQWPLIIVLDENNDTYAKLVEIFDIVKHKIDSSKINVFFRMKEGHKNSKEFNQFVKDNNLNNYIDSETRCVFISKTRIPKPLLRSEWKPATAMCFINYDYGKLGVYLNDISTVYYVNNSITTKHDRFKRNIKIVQL